MVVGISDRPICSNGYRENYSPEYMPLLPHVREKFINSVPHCISRQFRRCYHQRPMSITLQRQFAAIRSRNGDVIHGGGLGNAGNHQRARPSIRASASTAMGTDQIFLLLFTRSSWLFLASVSTIPMCVSNVPFRFALWHPLRLLSCWLIGLPGVPYTG